MRKYIVSGGDAELFPYEGCSAEAFDIVYLAREADAEHARALAAKDARIAELENALREIELEGDDCAAIIAYKVLAKQ